MLSSIVVVSLLYFFEVSIYSRYKVKLLALDEEIFEGER